MAEELVRPRDVRVPLEPPGLPREIQARRWVVGLEPQDARRLVASRMGAQRVWQRPERLRRGS